MHKKILLLLTAVLPFYLPAQNIETLIIKLDSTINAKEYFTKKKIEKINKLKNKLEIYESDNNLNKEYETCLNLFYEYQSFIYDSAFYYVEKAKYNSIKLKDSVKFNQSRIKQGFVLLSSGLFKEAIDTLESVNVKILPNDIKSEYYSIFGRAYYDLADYGLDPQFIKNHQRKGNTYLDSSLIYTVKNTNEYWYRESLRRMKEEDWKGAKHAFSYWINNFDLPDHYDAIATSSLGYIYSMTGSTEKATEYLIRAAISDIKKSTKETVALRNLSKILFQKGDKKRAYDYIILALADARFYNARHRKIEIASILPIIEGERLAMVESQKRKLIWLTSSIAALGVFVLIFLITIYHQLRKLRIIRKELQKSVNNLNDINIQLRESNRIKEEYIGYFFNINSEFIEKLDEFQSLVARKLSQKKYDEIHKLLNKKNIRNERQLLFHRFDEIFLKIFPNFISEYNKLFNEKDHINLKPGELMNSELRIFGLIRLGIKDNETISKFLNFSITTIYTYKTKAKARSIFKDDFENKLMGIKAF